MFEGLTACLSVVSTCLIAVVIVFLYKFKAGLPDFQQVFDDFGGSMSENLESIFEKPMVKKSMTVLGKQSGEARADKALQKKVAQQAVDQIPAMGLILKQFNLTPLEGLKLMNDPLIGPLIQRGIAMAGKAAQDATKGFGGSGGGSPSGFKGYGREE